MFKFILSFLFFFFFSFSSFAFSSLSIPILHISDVSKLTPFLGKSFLVVPDEVYVGSSLVAYEFHYYLYSRVRDNNSIYFGSFINGSSGGIVINLNPSYLCGFDSSGFLSPTGSASNFVFGSGGFLSLDNNTLIFTSYPSSMYSDACSNSNCDSCSNSNSDNSSQSFVSPFSYNYVTPPGLNHPSGVPSYCYLSCSQDASGYNDYLNHYPFPNCDNLSKPPCFLYDKDSNGFNTDCVDGHTRDYYCHYDDNSNFIDCSFGQVVGNVYNYSSDYPLFRSFLSNPSPFQTDSAGSVVVPTPYLTVGSAEDYNGCSVARVYYHLDIDFSPSNSSSSSSTACLLNPTPPAPGSLVINNFDNHTDNVSVSIFNAFSESNNRKILNSLNKLNDSLNPSSDSLPSHTPLSSGDFDSSLPSVSSDNLSSLFSDFLSNSPFSFSGSSLHLSDSFCSFSGSLFGSNLSISFCDSHIVSFLNVLGSFLVLFSVFLFFFISFR